MYNMGMPGKSREIDEPDVPIHVRQLVVGTKIPCNLFIKENNELKVLFNRGVLYTKTSQDTLKEKSISQVCIFRRDVPSFDFYLSRNRALNQGGDDDSIAAFKEYVFNKQQHYQIDPVL